MSRLSGWQRVFPAASAADMQSLGERLGRLMQVGDVVGLLGPLGAGKTTFAQGIARGLEVPPDRHVASPTFALVNQHPGRVPFVHADLYRINQPAELAELGLAEALRLRGGGNRVAGPLPRRSRPPTTWRSRSAPTVRRRGRRRGHAAHRHEKHSRSEELANHLAPLLA